MNRVVITAIDLHAGMPPPWTRPEGTPIVATARLMPRLLRSVEAA